MQTIIITGGRTLQGAICPETAKNSVLPLLAASLLCQGTVRLRAVPRLADVETSIALLRAVGAGVQRCGSELLLCAEKPLCGQIPAPLSRRAASTVSGSRVKSLFRLAGLRRASSCPKGTK